MDGVTEGAIHTRRALMGVNWGKKNKEAPRDVWRGCPPGLGTRSGKEGVVSQGFYMKVSNNYSVKKKSLTGVTEAARQVRITEK